MVTTGTNLYHFNILLVRYLDFHCSQMPGIQIRSETPICFAACTTGSSELGERLKQRVNVLPSHQVQQLPSITTSSTSSSGSSITLQTRQAGMTRIW